MDSFTNFAKRLNFLVAVLFSVILSATGCSTAVTTQSTANPANQENVSPSEKPDHNVRLNSVDYLGEVPIIETTNLELDASGQMKANEIIENSRFLIFRYNFTTIETEEHNLITYGETVNLWKGKDINADDTDVEAKKLTLQVESATFENGNFIITGNPSSSFVYEPNVTQTHYLIMVVPNSVSTEEMNLHFSSSSTVSNIGYDFKINSIKLGG